MTNTYTGPDPAVPRRPVRGVPDAAVLPGHARRADRAARIDGAGELRIFWRIVLPLCQPALATLAILTFLGSWNNFLWPLVVATTEDKYTLPVALALYSRRPEPDRLRPAAGRRRRRGDPRPRLFLLLQRHFVQGIAMTGIK